MSGDHQHDADHPCTCGCDKFGGETFNVHLEQSSPPRHVEYMGRDHLVVPVIMARADVVMNGNRVPIEELLPGAWNGVPVTIGHPEVGNGYSSANIPDVMNAWAIGQIFNSQLDGLILKGEAWIDVERCELLRPGLVTHLEEGIPMDVSTGYFSKKVPSSGVVNGRRYRALDTEINPDHLALLPDEIGACSWDDGCGVRANHKETPLKKTLGAAVTKLLGANSLEGKTPAEAYVITRDALLKLTPNARGEDDNPIQIICDLVSSDQSPFTPDDFYGLQQMSVDALVDLRDDYLGDDGEGTMNANHKENNVAGTEKGGAGKEPTIAELVANELKTQLPTVLKEALAPAIAEALKPVTQTMQTNALSAEDRSAIEEAKKITANHRAEVVTKITTNSTMTAEQLKDMTTPQLEIIANGLKPATDFSARGFGGAPAAKTESLNKDAPERAMIPQGTMAARAARKAAGAGKDKVN